MQFALGDSPNSLSPASLQMLNALAQDLNWLAIAVAVAGGSLFFAFVPLLVTPVWVLVVAIMMALTVDR